MRSGPRIQSESEQQEAVGWYKESYIKAVGKGLSLPLDSFSTVRQGSVEGHRSFDGVDWFFRTYPLDPEYVLTVCARNPHFSDSVRILALETLISS